MSKQPREARDRMERLKSKQALILPNQRNPRQKWLIIRQDPTDGSPGCFFVSHGANEEKFAKRKGFEILGYTFDRSEATALAHRATLICGASFQPQHSAHNENRAKRKPSVPDPLAEIPDAWDALSLEAEAKEQGIDYTISKPLNPEKPGEEDQ